MGSAAWRIQLLRSASNAGQWEWDIRKGRILFMRTTVPGVESLVEAGSIPAAERCLCRAEVDHSERLAAALTSSRLETAPRCREDTV